MLDGLLNGDTSIWEEFHMTSTMYFRYIVHKMYSLPFEVSPSVIDKDCLMIPAGWDTLQKISILNDTLRSFNLEDDLNTVSFSFLVFKIYLFFRKECSKCCWQKI